jgi:branched-subunit amino acid transport protein
VTPNEWLLIMGMAVVTFGIRFFLLGFANRFELPEILNESLKFIAPAVLTAITIPAVLLPSGKLDLSLGNPYLISAVAATAAGILSKNVLITIVVGLAAFFLIQIIM